MDTILDICRQEEVEYYYCRKHTQAKLEEAMLIESNQEKIEYGVQLLSEWMAKDHYASKVDRINQLRRVDLQRLVTKIFTSIAYFQKPTLFASAVSQIGAKLEFAEKRDAVQTIAEMLGVLCETDAFDLFRMTDQGSLHIECTLEIPETVIEHMERSQYLPPMVCEPLPLNTNYDSGYLTFKGSLILGPGNHHNGNISLDVLNTMNSVPLKLNVEFLKAVEEKPNKDYTVESIIEEAKKERHRAMLNPNATSIPEVPTERQAKLILQEMLEDFELFKKQSQDMYLLLGAKFDNKFYLTHKVDKRGRIYSQGYHINPQGASYKKASIELYNEELVEGS